MVCITTDILFVVLLDVFGFAQGAAAASCSSATLTRVDPDTVEAWRQNVLSIDPASVTKFINEQLFQSAQKKRQRADSTEKPQRKQAKLVRFRLDYFHVVYP
jgi:hypothetical protein